MRKLRWSVWMFSIAMVIPAFAQDKPAPAGKPLTIAAQGSFFVGGESKTSGNGDITVNQMYVQYQIPPQGAQHIPVVGISETMVPPTTTFQAWQVAQLLAIQSALQ